MKVVGDIYLILIKMLIVPIIFCAVCGGIANMQNVSDLKRIGIKTVILFVLMFVLSSVVSLGVAYTLRPGRGIVFKNIPVFDQEVTTPTLTGFLLSVFPSNPIAAMAEGKILPVISFTILFAISIVLVGDAAKPVLNFVNSLSAVCFKILDIIMETSPIGVMSLMAFSIANYGAGIFTALGKYIVTCYIACILTFLIAMVVPLILYTGMNFKALIKGLSKVWLVTLATTSSNAALPTSINVSTQEFKAPKTITNFILPLGATINMCGGACSFCCLAVFVSDFYSISLTLGELIVLIVVATLLNMAAPGIPGGGIILGASFLSIMGLPFDLMGPIAAFYRLLDMAFTTMNVTGDVVANLMVCKSEGVWDAEMVSKAETSAI